MISASHSLCALGEQDDYHSDPVTTVALEKLFLAAICFIKFDRKQNTRLWPFVFTDLTRSPPSVRLES
jgi:hypothetical protein